MIAAAHAPPRALGRWLTLGCDVLSKEQAESQVGWNTSSQPPCVAVAQMDQDVYTLPEVARGAELHIEQLEAALPVVAQGQHAAQAGGPQVGWRFAAVLVSQSAGPEPSHMLLVLLASPSVA